LFARAPVEFYRVNCIEDVMSEKLTPVEALDLWQRVTLASVQQDTPDLSARQMALLLTVYLTQPPHTVRGLADILKVSKPAVTRAVDRLGELGMVKRKVDDKDRRSVLIQRTVKGSVFLREFGDIIVAASHNMAEADANSE
jgi:DNA-binding MarR family transcriptional regulator